MTVKLIMRKISISEGVLIVLCPLIAYFLSFCNEIGFCLYFNIPFELISPSKITLIQVVLTFLFIPPVILFVIHCVAFTPTRKFLNKNLRITLEIVAATLSIALFAWVFFFRGDLVLGLCGMILLLFLALIAFIESLQQTITETSSEKESVAREKNNKIDLLQKFKISFFLLIFILSVSFILYDSSLARASRKRWYFVCENTPPRVLLKVYGDKFIFAAVDEKTKELGNEIFIYNTANIPELKLVYKKIGPLISQYKGEL